LISSLYQPASRRELDAPPDILARGPNRLVVRERVTAIQPIKLVGEASRGWVRQPRGSDISKPPVRKLNAHQDLHSFIAWLKCKDTAHCAVSSPSVIGKLKQGFVTFGMGFGHQFALP
jgi:hypothetical protein